MLGLLILFFTVVPMIELYFLIQAADAFGGLNTVGFVILTGVAGAILAKSQGRSMYMQIQSKLAQGQLPTEEMIQGMMILVGGVLLVTPGFVTDALGLLMVFPLSRWAFVSYFKNYFKHQVSAGNVKVYTHVHQSQSWTEPASETTLRDVTPPQIEK